MFLPKVLDAICEDAAIDTVVTHTAPSFCELTSKSGLASMAIRDEDLMAHVKYERQVMDKILDYLKSKGQPLCHWLQPLDRILLCTDGLYNAIDDEVLLHTLQCAKDVEQVADKYRAICAEKVNDNYTAIIIEME